MTNDEFEFILFDRIEKIKQINAEYDLENNAYISFSGGGDSTILHYLIDLALPNNKIPRVFINTGIEYNEIVDYVKELSKKDDRVVLYNSCVNIKQMLEEQGYPFKSKAFAEIVRTYYSMKGKGKKISDLLKSRIENKDCLGGFNVPKNLHYIFEKELNFKISQKCCNKLKKEPAKKWMKENNRQITLTGMRAEEGGNRTAINCVVTDNENNLKKFHPLLVVNSDFTEHFIKKYNIKLCKLYYPPYNFKRTGCKGCPFALDLQSCLDKMELFFPNEAKQCENLWKPVYEEYRRIGYRLRKETNQKQLDIFDFI